MITVVYLEGPDRLTAGVAGEFIRGVPKELPDDIANLVLGDPMFKTIEPKNGGVKNVTSDGK